MEKKGYQIRHAGGKYWLLDMNQDGLCYKIPPSLNETGAYIYERLLEGRDFHSIAEEMNNDFGIEVSDALRDIEEFIEMMKQKGILREGWDI